MERLTPLLFAFFALAAPSPSSEEEFVPWKTVVVTAEIEEAGGPVTVSAATDGGTITSLSVEAFDRKDTLGADDLKILGGCPLSSLQLTHEAGYESTGGHSVNIRFKRPTPDGRGEEVIVMTTKTGGSKILIRPVPAPSPAR